jgi:peptidoglycan/xylan/chitin deacetylase (PgdA/CDA1 family)
MKFASVALLLATLLPNFLFAEDALVKPKPPVRPEIITDCDTPGGYGRLCFPDGLTKALTMSFDDGRVYDYQLVEQLDRAGLRATFHLVSGLLDKPDYVKSADVKKLFAKHEVASHTVTHANLAKLSDEDMAYQVMQDRLNLEKLVGYPVRGLAYPGGESSEHVAEMLPKFGIRYARTVGAHHWFALPKNSPYFWTTTCHITDMVKDGKRFLEWKTAPALMFVWGHSYEFHENKAWPLLEEFGKLVGQRKDIWYATNIEVWDYYDAAKRLVVSMDGKTILNPSALAVWVKIGEQTHKLEAGKTTAIP